LTASEEDREAALVVLHDEEDLRDVPHQENQDGAALVAHRKGEDGGGIATMSRGWRQRLVEFFQVVGDRLDLLTRKDE
jgi:hypothetical protein